MDIRKTLAAFALSLRELFQTDDADASLVSIGLIWRF
jgi:hypothetical protein